jgi:hypothetical protein
MKHLKFAILGTAFLGLIGIFLPLISAGSASISLWDVRKLDSGMVYLTMVAFIVPLIMGGLAVAQGRLARWQAIVATVGFALALIKVRDAFGGAIGGKLMVVAAAAGLAVAIAKSVKPDPTLA